MKKGQANINGLPVYEAGVSEDGCGIQRVSLVDDPAVMVGFQAFAAQKEQMRYAVTDEERRLVHGCIMRADFPIYRRDDTFGEYYIIYRAATIRAMAEKYLTEGRANAVSLEHEAGSEVEGVNMVQWYIKGRGLQPEGFEDVADGSLFAEYHVTNDEIWADIKEGTYKGFSLEGVFEVVPEENQKAADEAVRKTGEGNFAKETIMGKVHRVLAALAKMLQALGAVTTDKGVLVWDGEDIAVGVKVEIEDVDGDRVAAADGEYTAEDGRVFVVEGGEVKDIREAETEAVEMGSVATDRGELHWDGEEDLKAGDAVYTLDENGERVAVEDGEYITEDGKTIVMADGKVAEIRDNAAEVAPEEMNRFGRVRAVFEATYDDRRKAIVDAISASGLEDFYLLAAGDTFAVASQYDGYAEKLYRYPVEWSEDGSVAKVGEPVEVRQEFVPVDEPERDWKAEVEQLRRQLAKLKKQSAAKPAHEEVKASADVKATGHKGLDRIAKIMAAK